MFPFTGYVSPELQTS